jgi:hypothetical protein
MSDKMVTFTYDDGERIATVNWTEAYGFMAAGDRSILDLITYDERDPRRPNVGTVQVRNAADQFVGFEGIDIGSPVTLEEPVNAVGCISCGHREHNDECQIPVRSGPGPTLPCGCKFVTA